LDINIIGVPLFYGCDRKGVELAPDIIRHKGVSEIISKYNHTVYDLGNIYVPQVDAESKYISHKSMKYLNEVIETNRNLAQAVYSSLCANSLPFVIGGDHSLGLGTISGASKFYRNLAVIWIDAHGDVNTEETSPTGNIHGMPLAASMNIGHSSLTDLFYKGQKVNPNNVFILAARDLDEGEVELIKERKLNVYTMKDIRNRGLESIVKEIMDKISENNADGVHLSFDIDSIDPEHIPGTGTPVEDGLSIDEAKYILKTFVQSEKISSIDMVEFNSDLDHEDARTSKAVLDLIDHTFKNLH